MWQWLTQTDAGLAARIIAGALVFAVLALLDYRRNGAKATRWREYAFLLLCVVAAMLYGIVNDLITSTISWEYFCYGKGLWPDVIADIPPDRSSLMFAAAIVGMKATWTAGLIIGVGLLLANNVAQRSYPFLTRMLGLILLITLLSAAMLGTAGVMGWLTWTNSDFAIMVRNSEMRPFRFMAVFGIHLGGYIGGLLGLIAAVWGILHRRFQKIPNTSQ